MITSIKRIKFGFILIFLALILILALMSFRFLGYFNLMLDFRIIYFVPVVLFLLSQIVRAYRLFFIIRKFDPSFSKVLSVHLFSENLGHLLFPFFKEIYAMILSLFLYKEKIKFIKTLLWIRTLDTLFILASLLILKNTILIISDFMLYSFWIYGALLIGTLSLLFILKKERNFTKVLIENLGYSSIQTLWIWLLEMTALGFFLNMTSGVFSMKEVGFNLILNLTPIESLHYKWFYLIMLLATIATFLLEGFRNLSFKEKS